MTRRKAPISQCAKCPTVGPVDKMGLCRACRLRMFSPATYRWTPEKDAKLVRAYQGSSTKSQLSKALTILEAEFRFPRHILANRAQTLGLCVVQSRPWTADDIEYLLDHAGSVSIKRLAKRMHRSEEAVKNKLFRHQIKGRLEEGYTQKGLADLLGVGRPRITAWIRRGLLELDSDIADRISHKSARAFVLFHMEEYSLRRVEEWWMKTLVREELEYRTSGSWRQRAA
jgi:hypothetical protein